MKSFSNEVISKTDIDKAVSGFVKESELTPVLVSVRNWMFGLAAANLLISIGTILFVIFHS